MKKSQTGIVLTGSENPTLREEVARIEAQFQQDIAGASNKIAKVTWQPTKRTDLDARLEQERAGGWLDGYSEALRNHESEGVMDSETVKYAPPMRNIHTPTSAEEVGRWIDDARIRQMSVDKLYADAVSDINSTVGGIQGVAFVGNGPDARVMLEKIAGELLSALNGFRKALRKINKLPDYEVDFDKYRPDQERFFELLHAIEQYTEADNKEIDLKLEDLRTFLRGFNPKIIPMTEGITSNRGRGSQGDKQAINYILTEGIILAQERGYTPPLNRDQLIDIGQSLYQTLEQTVKRSDAGKNAFDRLGNYTWVVNGRRNWNETQLKNKMRDIMRKRGWAS